MIGKEIYRTSFDFDGDAEELLPFEHLLLIYYAIFT